MVQKYFKFNYIDVVKLQVPQLYEDEDIQFNGTTNDPVYEVLRKVAYVAKDFDSDIFNVPNKSVTDIIKYFTESNKLTQVTPLLFNSKINKAFNKSFSDFATSAEYKTFLDASVIPNTFFNNVQSVFVSGVSANVDSTVITSALAEDHLLNVLGLAGLLNVSDTSLTYAASTVYSDLIVKNLFYGKEILTVNAAQALFEILWRNSNARPEFKSYIPTYFLSAVDQTQQYTSGIQPLESLQVLLGIIYNNENNSTIVSESIYDAVTSAVFPYKNESAGPFIRFLMGLGFSFYDMKEIVDGIGNLLDIENCPKEFFHYLSKYIGWNLKTGNIDLWRAQLRQATYIYKSKGTKESLIGALGAIFPSGTFNPLSGLQTVWESYIPFLIYYTIATESSIFNSSSGLEDISKRIIQFLRQAQIDSLKANSIDANIRLATDYVIARIHQETSCITIGESPYTFRKIVDPRRTTVVPLWEYNNYYKNILITEQQLSSLQTWLTKQPLQGGLGVPTSAVNSLLTYIRENSLNNFENFNGTTRAWQFFTPSSNRPFNFSSLIADGRSQLFDYWNSKSSTIFLFLQASDFTLSSHDEEIDTLKAVEETYNVLYEFKPFHVRVKLYINSDLTDQYLSQIQTCIYVTVGIPLRTDPDNYILNDANLSGWTGSYGQGSASIGQEANQYLEAPSSTFWTNGLVGGLERYSLRRRSFTHVIPALGTKLRYGDSMPLPLEFIGATAIPSSVTGIMNEVNYYPLGYNASTGKFDTFNKVIDASSYINGYCLIQNVPLVYDSSNTSSVSSAFFGIDVSNCFPTRVYNRDRCDRYGERRNLLTPAEYELWKLKDQQTLDSSNLIANSNFSSLEFWNTSSDNFRGVVKAVFNNKSALRFESDKWFTTIGTTDRAWATQTVSGLKANTDYDLEFSLLSVSPSSLLQNNNGVGVILTVSSNSVSAYYDWQNQQFIDTINNKCLFVPNWMSVYPEDKWNKFRIKFTTDLWVDDYTLHFYNFGSSPVSAVTATYTTETTNLTESDLVVNYVTDVSIKESVTNRDYDFVDLGSTSFKLYKKYLGIGRVFKTAEEGGNTLSSIITGPTIPGGSTFATNLVYSSAVGEFSNIRIKINSSSVTDPVDRYLTSSFSFIDRGVSSVYLLFPVSAVQLDGDSEFYLKIKTRTNGNSEKYGVTLRTSAIDSTNWYFNWKRQKWEPLESSATTYYIHEVPIAYSSDFTETTIEFHTLNGRCSIPPYDPSWINDNGLAHNGSRNYELLITRLSNLSTNINKLDSYYSVLEKSIVTIGGISIINKTLAAEVSSSVASSLDSLEILFNQFLPCVSGYLSRSVADSSGYHGVSGGARTIYLDEFGMSSGVSGVVNSNTHNFYSVIDT